MGLELSWRSLNIYKTLQVKIKDRMKQHLYILFLFVISISSCRTESDELKYAFSNAGNNTKELKKVLEHYSSPADSLKLKAAVFLINNMHDAHFIIGEQLNQYNTIFDVLENKSREWKENQPWYSTAVNDLYDSIINRYGKINLRKLRKYNDIAILDANYIIQNIEEAFQAWNKPWAKHISFDQFCEYILPYRIQNEQTQLWRKPYAEKYGVVINSLSDTTNPLTIGKAIYDTAIPFFSSAFDYYPVSIAPLDMLRSEYGNCFGNACFKTYAMRSVGVPCVVDFIPVYGNNPNEHYWNSTLDKYGNSVSFEEPFGDDQSKVVFKPKFKVAKIYRKTFAVQKQNLQLLEHANNMVPELFKNVKYIDVTNEYVATTDVKLKLNNVPDTIRYAYICVFDIYGWRPVHYSEITNNKSVVFTDMAREVVYLPMYYSNDSLIAAGNPFLLSKRGLVKHFEADENDPIQLVLNRKFNKSQRKINWQKCLVNGEFQGSNTRNFSHPTVLHRITNMPSEHLDTFQINKSEKFRYVRFVFNEDSSSYKGEYDGTCIAEIQFYDTKFKELNGKAISNPENKASFYPPENCFDNNPLTFYEDRRKSKDKYVGLDFGLNANTKIKHIAFQARNDLNAIQPGNTYELLYWKNDRFQTLYTQKANDTTLTFTNVPSEGLYWLKCIDGGTEERIFTYENNKQIWW
jgi:hypothetical protein